MTQHSIRQGTTLLDRAYPGWEQGIDLTTLNLASAETCVLGQMFGHYEDGVYELGLTFSDASQFGFNTRGNYDTYRNLTNRWRRAIRRRLNQRGE